MGPESFDSSRSIPRQLPLPLTVVLRHGVFFFPRPNSPSPLRLPLRSSSPSGPLSLLQSCPGVFFLCSRSFSWCHHWWGSQKRTRAMTRKVRWGMDAARATMLAWWQSFCPASWRSTAAGTSGPKPTGLNFPYSPPSTLIGIRNFLAVRWPSRYGSSILLYANSLT